MKKSVPIPKELKASENFRPRESTRRLTKIIVAITFMTP